MIEITIDKKNGRTKKLLNPSNVYLGEEDFGLAVQSDTINEEDCQEAFETHILPASGDQRIWSIANFGNEITPDLNLCQYRVIGYKVERELLTDCTKVLPLSTGMQWGALDEYPNSAIFLVDMDLRQINLIDTKDFTAKINEEKQTTDIMGAISQALKIPLLAESDLPIQLQEYLKENPALKQTVNLK